MRQLDYSDPGTFYPKSTPKTADGVEFKLGMTIYEPTYPFDAFDTSEEAHEIVESPHEDPRGASTFRVRFKAEDCVRSLGIGSAYSTLALALDAEEERQLALIKKLRHEANTREAGLSMLRVYKLLGVKECSIGEALFGRREEY